MPGHTLGHIALIFEEERVAFVGDTLFAMGCGRLFEGTPQQMYSSLQRLAALPDGHRALLRATNIRSRTRGSPSTPSPDNAAIAERLEEVEAMRDAGKITLPTTVAQERETNPFVRASNWQEFARLRTRQRQLPFMNEGVQNRAGRRRNFKEVEYA